MNWYGWWSTSEASWFRKGVVAKVSEFYEKGHLGSRGLSFESEKLTTIRTNMLSLQLRCTFRVFGEVKKHLQSHLALDCHCKSEIAVTMHDGRPKVLLVLFVAQRNYRLIVTQQLANCWQR